MVAANPFVYGSPVPAARFVGRAEAVNTVITRLTNSAHESTSIVAADRLGRTSFLRYLTSPELRARRKELQPFLPAFFDGQQGQLLDSQDIWKQIMRSAKTASGDRSLDETIDRAIALTARKALTIDVLEDLLDALAGQGRLLFLVIDDFHRLMDNPRLLPPDPFLNLLRSFALRLPPAFALVLATPRPLFDLWKAGSGWSPFYNNCATVNLGYFADEDVDELLRIWLSGTGVTFTDDDRRLILLYSAKHPMLAQYAAYVVYQCYIEGIADRARAVREAFRESDGPAVVLCRHLLGQLDHRERALLDQYAKDPAALQLPERECLEECFRRGALLPGMEVTT